MYRLFQRIPKGLEPVAESFRKHVESEGLKLVKEATEAATAKKDKDVGKPSKDTGLTSPVLVSSSTYTFVGVADSYADMMLSRPILGHMSHEEAAVPVL